MKRSRFSEGQIIGVLYEGAGGTPVREVCRKLGSLSRPSIAGEVSTVAFRGETASALEDDNKNKRLKTLVADFPLDNAMLKDVVGRKCVTTTQRREAVTWLVGNFPTSTRH
jgi:putative transposase